VPLTSLGNSIHDQHELAQLLADAGFLVEQRSLAHRARDGSRNHTPRTKVGSTLEERIQGGSALGEA
jgi:hypothetical protein